MYYLKSHIYIGSGILFVLLWDGNLNRVVTKM